MPVYDQKLSFGCTVMADVESLDFYRLKDGDQITLKYTTTVDVQCAFHLMSLHRNALEFVKNEQCQLASGKISPVFSKIISDTIHALPYSHSPWLESKKQRGTEQRQCDYGT